MADVEEFRLRFRRKFAEKINKELARSNDDNDAGPKPQRNKTSINVQNILWLLASIATVHYTDIVPTILYDARVNRLWLNVGAALITVNVLIAVFLIVFLSMVWKLSSDVWDERYPAAIPIATAAFIIGAFCVTVGIWPVWSYLTPVILFTIFMGFVVIIAALPAF